MGAPPSMLGVSIQLQKLLTSWLVGQQDQISVWTRCTCCKKK